MDKNTPLAERMRPQKLDDFVGQEHLVSKGKPLEQVISSGNLHSMIFWGPPGIGKTTLANIIAKELDKVFITLSAISSGVKDVRQVIDMGKKQGNLILFIDEIHRFNKAQQDSLLNAVEKGYVTLIGATTENPSFEVISALLSRCQVYILKELGKDDLLKLVNRAIAEDEFLTQRSIKLKEYEALLMLSGGDARKLLNLLEIAVNSVGGDEVVITNELVTNNANRKVAKYDKSGEQHYDIISAFIKSIRGSDPNGALYWLARMIEGGEDPKFIARRLLIAASEDIGNANPTALVLANSCFQAVNVIGFPESQLILSQTTIYLATSPKSNSATTAIGKARQLVRDSGDLEVPLHIRNAPTNLMKELNYGKNYKYAHGFEGNFEAQEYLPEKVAGTQLFEPGDNPRENEMRKQLKNWWKEKYGY